MKMVKYKLEYDSIIPIDMSDCYDGKDISVNMNGPSYVQVADNGFTVSMQICGAQTFEDGFRHGLKHITDKFGNESLEGLVLMSKLNGHGTNMELMTSDQEAYQRALDDVRQN